MKQSIKLFLIVEILIISTKLYSFDFFINLQVAFLSSFFIIIGSAFAYKKMVNTQVKAKNMARERDVLDIVEDPHELYDDYEINEAPAEELDLKEIVKEEKKKIKTLNLKTLKEGGRAGFSMLRLVPYLFLVLGFIALKNNNLLDIAIYLPSLAVGIITASLISKHLKIN